VIKKWDIESKILKSHFLNRQKWKN